MTMIIAVLSPNYALALADRRANTDIKIAGFNFRVEQQFQKLWPSDDRVSLLGVAGTVPFHGTYVDDVKNLGGCKTDEAIAARYVAHGAFEDFPSLPAGEWHSEQSIHIYPAAGRYIICAQSINRVKYERMYIRNSPVELRHTIIGSGLEAAPQLLSEEPFKSEWDALSKRLGLDAFDEVFGFWVRVIRAVSQRVPSVGDTFIAARMTAQDPRWVSYNPKTTTWMPIPSEA